MTVQKSYNNLYSDKESLKIVGILEVDNSLDISTLLNEIHLRIGIMPPSAPADDLFRTPRLGICHTLHGHFA
jgi:hypothetical protein